LCDDFIPVICFLHQIKEKVTPGRFHLRNFTPNPEGIGKVESQYLPDKFIKLEKGERLHQVGLKLFDFPEMVRKSPEAILSILQPHKII
jgi:hypothetical protein